MYNWSNAVCPHNGPDEEGYASWRDEVGFGGEEMSDLMYWEPNGG